MKKLTFIFLVSLIGFNCKSQSIYYDLPVDFSFGVIANMEGRELGSDTKDKGTTYGLTATLSLFSKIDVGGYFGTSTYDFKKLWIATFRSSDYGFFLAIDPIKEKKLGINPCFKFVNNIYKDAKLDGSINPEFNVIKGKDILVTLPAYFRIYEVGSGVNMGMVMKFGPGITYREIEYMIDSENLIQKYEGIGLYGAFQFFSDIDESKFTFGIEYCVADVSFISFGVGYVFGSP
jgi:hypothetical protein